MSALFSKTVSYVLISGNCDKQKKTKFYFMSLEISHLFLYTSTLVALSQNVLFLT